MDDELPRTTVEAVNDYLAHYLARAAHTLVLDHVGYGEDCKYLFINTRKSKWFDIPLTELGAYGRRRFENWVILERPRERFKLIYGNH